jgi:hypothetical protein
MKNSEVNNMYNIIQKPITKSNVGEHEPLRNAKTGSDAAEE